MRPLRRAAAPSIVCVAREQCCRVAPHHIIDGDRITPKLLFIAFLLSASATSKSPALAQSGGTNSPKARAPRPRTCVKGLREYASQADVPQPFDTLRLNVPPTAVDPANFRAFILRVFAQNGATGFISLTETDQAFFAIPIFVPADSARIAAACRDSITTRPPSGEGLPEVERAKPFKPAVRRIALSNGR